MCVFFIPVWDPGTSSNPASFVLGNRMLSFSASCKDTCPASEKNVRKHKEFRYGHPQQTGIWKEAELTDKTEVLCFEVFYMNMLENVLV